MIVSTSPYGAAELRHILTIRCEEEDVEMADEAMDLLTRIAQETTLRYAIQLIMTSALVCAKRKGTEVEVADITKCYGLFVDVRRSTQFLMEYNAEYMFNEFSNKGEEEEEEEDDDDDDDDDDVKADAEGDVALSK
jgi:RuvB-like protein 2